MMRGNILRKGFRADVDYGRLLYLLLRKGKLLKKGETEQSLAVEFRKRYPELVKAETKMAVIIACHEMIEERENAARKKIQLEPGARPFRSK